MDIQESHEGVTGVAGPKSAADEETFSATASGHISAMNLETVSSMMMERKVESLWEQCDIIICQGIQEVLYSFF